MSTQETRTCVCGRAFTPPLDEQCNLPSTMRYCGDKCRVRAQKQRREQRLTARGKRRAKA